MADVTYRAGTTGFVKPGPTRSPTVANSRLPRSPLHAIVDIPLGQSACGVLSLILLDEDWDPHKAASCRNCKRALSRN